MIRGFGNDEFAAARKRMVAEQLSGGGRSVTDARVLAALLEVPRHEFVPKDLQAHAYEDRPLPIGNEQTISQPFIVGYMTESLRLTPADRVLEIGTGSGYQAAVAARLAREVYSIEIVQGLAFRATKTLFDLKITNVYVRVGDGYMGWPQAAPFDAIIVTCAPGSIPEPLIQQLKEGGRMAIPLGTNPHQELLVLEKHQGQLHQKSELSVRFVPMTGEHVG